MNVSALLMVLLLVVVEISAIYVVNVVVQSKRVSLLALKKVLILYLECAKVETFRTARLAVCSENRTDSVF